MACPYFEPQRPATASHRNARLPLIEEFDGLCHAASEPRAVPDELRFRYCNHGYSCGACEHLPADGMRSSLRYTVVKRTDAGLEVMCIEEQDYAPVRWQTVQFRLLTETIEPEPVDCCLRAQILAFCRTYARQFAH
jgi:hypothetical protein